MLQNYKPENKELADLAKKYKEPLRQVEKLMIPGFSNEDFYLIFKTCYAQFWKDLENVYHHCKNSDRVWVEKGKDPVYNCPEPQEFLERLSRMYIERTRERLEQGGEYLSDDDRKGIIAELSLAGKSEIERKKSKRKQDIYEYLASDVFVSHNLEDDDAFLSQLSQILNGEGLTVYIHNRSSLYSLRKNAIPKNYKKIISRVRACRSFLFIPRQDDPSNGVAYWLLGVCTAIHKPIVILSKDSTDKQPFLALYNWAHIENGSLVVKDKDGCKPFKGFLDDFISSQNRFKKQLQQKHNAVRIR